MSDGRYERAGNRLPLAHVLTVELRDNQPNATPHTSSNRSKRASAE